MIACGILIVVRYFAFVLKIVNELLDYLKISF
jgi:hypothetical protein